MGAALHWLRVKTPAATAGNSEMMIPKSGRYFLTPELMPLHLKPCGSNVLPIPGPGVIKYPQLFLFLSLQTRNFGNSNFQPPDLRLPLTNCRCTKIQRPCHPSL